MAQWFAMQRTNVTVGGEGLAGHQGMSAEHALVPISLTLNSLSNGPQTISMTFSHPHLSPRL